MTVYKHNGVVVRESRESDIAALKDRLREADEKEIIAAGNKDSEEALTYSYAHSELRYTVDIEGVPVAMFGVVADVLPRRSANVWFLGTPEMSRIKKTFVMLSRKFLAAFLEKYPDGLWNFVDCRYTQTFRWLEACGASFSHKTTDFNGVEFSPFIIPPRRA